MHDEAKIPDSLDRVILDALGATLTVRELRDRVTMLEPNIVLMREIDKGTPETLAVLVAAIEEIAAGLDAFGVVLDLSDAAGMTTPEYRRCIPGLFEGMNARTEGRLKLISVVFKGSPILRVATRFLIGRMTRVPFGLEKNRELSLEAVRLALRGAT